MPLPPNPVRRLSLADEVYARLEAAILDGTLRPEERLHDSEIERWLGVSRTPIRNALDRLAEQGLVETRKSRYTRVAPIDYESVRHAVEVIGDLWAVAAGNAVADFGDVDREAVESRVREVRAAVADSDAIEFCHAFERLRASYLHLEGNPVRAEMVHRLAPRMRRLSRKRPAFVHPDTIERFLDGLLSATRARDGEGVSESILTYFTGDLLPRVVDPARA